MALVLAALNRSRAAFAAVLVAVVTLNWAFVVRVLPSFERYKPVPSLSAVIRERLGPGDEVVHYNVALPSMVFYLRRHIDVLFDREAFLERLRAGQHRLRRAVGERLRRAAARDRPPDLRPRAPADGERQAEGGPRARSAARGVVDHQPV